jgi:hypothetical protein
MALRGVKPKAIEKRLKLFLFGVAGGGKTTGSIQFPGPYLIDCERGAENKQYVDLLASKGGRYFNPLNPNPDDKTYTPKSIFEEVLAEVTALLTTKHQFRTLIIDPLTVVYNELTDAAARSLVTREDPEGMAFGRHKAKADRQIKHLFNLLLRLDMNVVLTSHAKKLWGAGMTDLGNTFDCYSKADYLFDLVIEIQKRGVDRVGRVIKTRIDGFKEAEIFPFSYDEIAARYGREVLERDAVAQTLATAEQITQLRHLIEVLKVPQDTIDKWLDKASADNIEELPTEIAAKCIEFLTNQVNKPQAA